MFYLFFCFLFFLFFFFHFLPRVILIRSIGESVEPSFATRMEGRVGLAIMQECMRSFSSHMHSEDQCDSVDYHGLVYTSLA